MKERQLPPGQRQEQLSQTEELRRLKSELKRVTEERDILKKAAAYFAKQSG
jgi:transposase